MYNRCRLFSKLGLDWTFPFQVHLHLHLSTRVLPSICIPAIRLSPSFSLSFPFIIASPVPVHCTLEYTLVPTVASKPSLGIISRWFISLWLTSWCTTRLRVAGGVCFHWLCQFSFINSGRQYKSIWFTDWHRLGKYGEARCCYTTLTRTFTGSLYLYSHTKCSCSCYCCCCYSVNSTLSQCQFQLPNLSVCRCAIWPCIFPLVTFLLVPGNSHWRTFLECCKMAHLSSRHLVFPIANVSVLFLALFVYFLCEIIFKEKAPSLSHSLRCLSLRAVFYVLYINDCRGFALFPPQSASHFAYLSSCWLQFGAIYWQSHYTFAFWRAHLVIDRIFLHTWLLRL